LPHEQVTLASPYLGWISAFMMLLKCEEEV
jgi:hypothetical protein